MIYLIGVIYLRSLYHILISKTIFQNQFINYLQLNSFVTLYIFSKYGYN